MLRLRLPPIGVISKSIPATVHFCHYFLNDKKALGGRNLQIFTNESRTKSFHTIAQSPIDKYLSPW